MNENMDPKDGENVRKYLGTKRGFPDNKKRFKRWVQKIGKKKLFLALAFLSLVGILYSVLDWEFKTEAIKVLPGVNISPPAETKITYIPYVFFETLNRDKYHVDNRNFFGGALSIYRKIEFFLETEISSGSAAKISYNKTTTYAEDEKERLEVYSGDLKQQFVLFPARKITSDVANLNPAFLSELFQKNPLRRIAIVIEVEISIEELESRRTRKEVVEIECKNMAYVEHAYPDATLSDFYPSCLVMDVSEL